MTRYVSCLLTVGVFIKTPWIDWPNTAVDRLLTIQTSRLLSLLLPCFYRAFAGTSSQQCLLLFVLFICFVWPWPKTVPALQLPSCTGRGKDFVRQQRQFQSVCHQPQLRHTQFSASPTWAPSGPGRPVLLPLGLPSGSMGSNWTYQCLGQSPRQLGLMAMVFVVGASLTSSVCMQL